MSGTQRETRTVNGEEVVRKENAHGVMKDHVEVDIGTSVVEVPRYIRNKLTDRREDLTRLSDDGYLKQFLALRCACTGPDIIDLGSAPYLSFDKDRWELRETDGAHVLVKREPETKFEEMALRNDRDSQPVTSGDDIDE